MYFPADVNVLCIVCGWHHMYLPCWPAGEVLLNLRYVVFEYCSGSDLFNFLVTGPFERTNR